MWIGQTVMQARQVVQAHSVCSVIVPPSSGPGAAVSSAITLSRRSMINRFGLSGWPEA